MTNWRMFWNYLTRKSRSVKNTDIWSLFLDCWTQVFWRSKDQKSYPKESNLRGLGCLKVKGVGWEVFPIKSSSRLVALVWFQRLTYSTFITITTLIRKNIHTWYGFQDGAHSLTTLLKKSHYCVNNAPNPVVVLTTSWFKFSIVYEPNFLHKLFGNIDFVC